MKINTIWPGGLVEIPWLEEDAPVTNWEEIKTVKPKRPSRWGKSSLDKKLWWQNYLGRIRRAKARRSSHENAMQII